MAAADTPTGSDATGTTSSDSTKTTDSKANSDEEFAPDDEDHNLVGVLLLDTSPIGGAVERGLAKIPDDIPVYAIARNPMP